MFLFIKPQILLATFLASLTVSPCFAVPIGSGSSSPQPSNTAEVVTTPANKITMDHPAQAPIKGEGRAPVEITSFVADWMRKSEARVRGMPFTQGGSEAWVQYDFDVETKLRQGISPESPTKFREVKVYEGSSKAADWVFPEGNNHKGLIVELKVESLAQATSTFASLVLADQKKVGGTLKDEYKDYDTAVLAIAWEPATKNALTKINMIPVADAKIPLTTIPGQSVQLFEWKNDSNEKKTESGDPSSSLEANTPPPKKAGLQLRPPPGAQIPQTPKVESPSGQPGDQTPGIPETPSKKTGKLKEGLKGAVGKLKLGGTSKNGPPK